MTTTGLDELYGYDGLSRLTGTHRGTLTTDRTGIIAPTGNQSWTLDGMGNWSSQQQDANGDGDYTDAGDIDQTREHNAANEITDISGAANAPVYDAAGNTLADGSRMYSYDAWNRLTAVHERQADGSQGRLIASYRYDGNGYRIAKAVARYDDSENPSVITGYDRTDYYYNTSWQVVEERYAANVAPANVEAPAPPRSCSSLGRPPAGPGGTSTRRTSPAISCLSRALLARSLVGYRLSLTFCSSRAVSLPSFLRTNMHRS